MYELDKNKLEKNLVWQTENFNRSVERVYMLIESLKRDVDYAYKQRGIKYADGLDDYSHSDAAAHIVHSVIQAVNNMDLSRLIEDAADVATAERMLASLEQQREAMPEDVRRLIEESEDKALAMREADQEAEIRTREDRLAAQCEISVSDGGRAMGFHRCGRKHQHEIVLDDGSAKVCTQHQRQHLDGVHLSRYKSQS